MYTYYKIARDRAWQTLIETKVDTLPINLTKILTYYNVEVHLLENSNEEAFIKDNTIFLSKHLSKHRARFTIAHELGHILLNHNELSHTIHNENDNKNIEEFQANIFARGLLMPAIVLKEINCIETQDISNICNVSLQTARYRSERLKELLKRNKFNLSPLEQQVYINFKNFISIDRIKNK